MDDAAWRGKYALPPAVDPTSHCTGESCAELESDEDLVQRCRARLSAEEAESCVARLEDRCITWDILRAGVTADDLAEELGFTARECDAVLLDDAAWRGKYESPPAVDPTSHCIGESCAELESEEDLVQRRRARLSAEEACFLPGSSRSASRRCTCV